MIKSIHYYSQMARKGFPSDISDQFNIRMPAGMREKIAKIAEASGRSMNSEIIARLEQSLAVDEQARATMNQEDPLKGIVALCEHINRGTTAIAALALEAGIKSGKVKIVVDDQAK